MAAPNKFVTIIFVLAVIYVIYEFAHSPGEKKTHPKPDEVNELSAGEVILKKPSLKESPSGEDTYAKEERRKMLKWDKDPFSVPKALEPYKKTGAGYVEDAAKEDLKTGGKAQIALSLRVTSILFSKRQKVATIDRAPYVVSVGDWVQNERVLKIMPDRIVLGRNGMKRVLVLESLTDSSINIRVTK